MDSKNLILFLVVGLAFLFVISTFSGKEELTGRTVNRGVKSCADNDGLNLMTKGTVTVITGSEERDYNDACVGGEGLRVKENYCVGDRRAFTYEFCPSGMKCSSGRCATDTTSTFY